MRVLQEKTWRGRRCPLSGLSGRLRGSVTINELPEEILGVETAVASEGGEATRGARRMATTRCRASRAPRRLPAQAARKESADGAEAPEPVAEATMEAAETGRAIGCPNSSMHGSLLLNQQICGVHFDDLEAKMAKPKTRGLEKATKNRKLEL